MKFKISLLSAFAMFFVLTIIFIGCYNNHDIIITDCSTDKVVASFSTEENAEEAVMLTNAENNVGERAVKLNSKPKYLVHFVDPKDSLYDIYYYVYIEGNNMYIQYNMEEMQELEDISHFGFDVSIMKTNGITVKEFNSILTKFKK